MLNATIHFAHPVLCMWVKQLPIYILCFVLLVYICHTIPCTKNEWKDGRWLSDAAIVLLLWSLGGAHLLPTQGMCEKSDAGSVTLWMPHSIINAPSKHICLNKMSRVSFPFSSFDCFLRFQLLYSNHILMKVCLLPPAPLSPLGFHLSPDPFSPSHGFNPPPSPFKNIKKILFAFLTFFYYFKNFNLSCLWIDTVGTQAPIQLLALPVYPPVTRPFLYYNLIYLFHSCYFSISYKLNINNACTAIYRK